LSVYLYFLLGQGRSQTLFARRLDHLFTVVISYHIHRHDPVNVHMHMSLPAHTICPHYLYPLPILPLSSILIISPCCRPDLPGHTQEQQQQQQQRVSEHTPLPGEIFDELDISRVEEEEEEEDGEVEHTRTASTYTQGGAARRARASEESIWDERSRGTRGQEQSRGEDDPYVHLHMSSGSHGPQRGRSHSHSRSSHTHTPAREGTRTREQSSAQPSSVHLNGSRSRASGTTSEQSMYAHIRY
jgi:hypothetical protein